MTYYLAIDLGASSGRHILGFLDEAGRLQTEEIYRFPNGYIHKNGSDCWDYDSLFSHILEGMRRCTQAGKIPVSVGVDSWGVDFVLLDEAGKGIGDTVCYRDSRTENIDQVVYSRISEAELYRRTGIQKQRFNTIYQLMALKQAHPEQLVQAKAFLMVPEYFHYLLCGVAQNEYTNATTTGMVNAESGNWDEEILARCGYPTGIFGRLAMPGETLGELLPEIAARVGFSCKVVLPATHDTASAVVSVPSGGDALYISSGTWSLMGIESPLPNCSPQAQSGNFTNEGGYEKRYRFLKNIMGMWMIQNVRHELGDAYSFDELCQLAEANPIGSIVDCEDARFLAPPSMTQEIQRYCEQTNQPVPQTPGELAWVIYNSLAKCYATAAQEIERLTGKEYDTIHIIGGGAKADYLNRLTARAAGKRVIAGPSEATAIGNILCQMLGSKEITSLAQARRLVVDSFNLEVFQEMMESYV